MCLYYAIEHHLCSAANWLKPPGPQRRRPLSDLLPNWLTWRYIRNNLTWVIWLLLFAAANIVLFVEAAVRHRKKVGGVMWSCNYEWVWLHDDITIPFCDLTTGLLVSIGYTHIIYIHMCKHMHTGSTSGDCSWVWPVSEL